MPASGRLRIELPEMEVDARASLYGDAAPGVCPAIIAALSEPLETRTSHACFDGHAIYCFLPDFPEPPPLENKTMRPKPGELMFFYAPSRSLALMEQDRLTGGRGTIHELFFAYGEVDLRHYWEEGLHGSLVGRITDGFDKFAEACARTLSEGATPIRLSQV